MNSKLLKVLKRTGIILAGLIIIYTAALIVSGVKLRNARAKLAASGRPMTVEQVIPAKISDKDNAALLYNSAVMVLKAGGDAWTRVTPDQLSGTNRDEIIKCMGSKDVIDALALVKSGTAKAGCRYDLDYTKGPELALPHMSELRNLERLLAVQTKLLVERDERESAWNNVVIGYKLADAMHGEPTLIGQLVRTAMFGIADQVALDMCKVSPPNETQCEAIASAVKPFVENTSGIRSIDAERILMGEWAFRQPASDLVRVISMDGGASSSFIERVVVRAVFCKMGRQLLYASYLNVMADLAKYMETSYWEAPAAAGLAIENSIPRWDFISRMMVPALGNVKSKQAGLMAKAVMTKTAMSLMRHKLAHNGFPATLAECDVKFLPVQPVDPFSGKPLVYRPEGNGFILYSVGENMKDDGGKAEPKGDLKSKLSAEEQREKTWDLVWKYEAK